jgi:hypothetical protein
MSKLVYVKEAFASLNRYGSKTTDFSIHQGYTKMSCSLSCSLQDTRNAGREKPGGL